MPSKKNVAVVIAAYNEATTIKEVIQGVKRAGHPTIIVVNDGSKDDTSRIAREAGAIVLDHVMNRGQGAALKTGMDFAILSGADVVVTFDADGQHNPNEIKNVSVPVIEGLVDVALGSRFLTVGSNVPLLRRMTLKGGALLIRTLYGIRLTDSHNGFRALSRDAVRRMELRSDRMEHASEIINEISRKRLRYCEVPVTVQYTAHSMKNSKQGAFPALRIAWKMLMHEVTR